MQASGATDNISIRQSKQSQLINKPVLPSLKRNALGNWGVLCLNIVIGFFLTPAIVRNLDQQSFGAWMLASSIVGYFGLLKFGIGTAVLRHVPLYRGQGNQYHVSVVVSTAMAIYAVLGLLVFIVSWFAASYISAFFGGGSEFTVLLKIVGLAAAIQLPSEILDAAIRGYEHFNYANLVEITSALTRGVTLLVCVTSGFGLIPMGWTLVIVSLVTFFAEWFVFHRCCGDIKLNFRLVELSEFKVIFYFVLTILVCKFAEILTYESPKQILGKIVSIKAVGLLGVVVMLLSYYRRTIYAMTRVFMPRFSFLSGGSAYKEVNSLFIRGSKYTTILSMAIALPFLTVGPSFVQLWLNKSFGQTTPALIILTISTTTLVCCRLSIDLLYGLGKQVSVSIIDGIEGAGVFLLSFLFAHKYGLTGIALGIAVPMILVRTIAQIYVCRLLNMGFCSYFLICIFKPMAIVLVLAVLYHLAGITSLITTWGSLFLAFAMVMLTFCIVSHMIVLDNGEKTYLKQFTQRHLFKKWAIIKTP